MQSKLAQNGGITAKLQGFGVWKIRVPSKRALRVRRRLRGPTQIASQHAKLCRYLDSGGAC